MLTRSCRQSNCVQNSILWTGTRTPAWQVSKTYLKACPLCQYSILNFHQSLSPVPGAGLWSPGRLVEAPPRVLQPCTAGSWELQPGIILHVKGLLSRVLSDKQSYRVIIEVALLIFSTKKEKYLICPIWRSFMDQHLWLAANPFSFRHGKWQGSVEMSPSVSDFLFMA